MGSEYRIRKNKHSGLFYIWSCNGPLPKVLQGTFSSFNKAEIALIRRLKKTAKVLYPPVYPGIDNK